MNDRNENGSFLDRLRKVVPVRHLMMADLAYTVAKYAHRYAKHGVRKPIRMTPASAGTKLQRRVAIIIVDEAGVHDITTIVAALLHDAALDGRGMVHIAKLKSLFGDEVAKVLELLAERQERSRRLNEDGDWRYLFVKAAELLDELRLLKTLDEDSVRRHVKEIKLFCLPLFSRLERLTPKKYVRGARLIRDLIISLISDYEKQYPPK